MSELATMSSRPVPKNGLRVIMFPAYVPRNANRYIDILVKALLAAGAEVQNWNKHLSFQTGDVFHVHWPEIIPLIRRGGPKLRGDLIAFQFFRTIERVKRSGGHVVWTAHDLNLHDDALQEDEYYKRFMKEFLEKVDRVVSLTEAGVNLIKEYHPQVASRDFFVARHPHYRGALKKGDSRYIDKLVNFRIGQRIVSFIGALRSNKRPESLAEAFLCLPQDKFYLVLAGETRTEMAKKLLSILSSSKNTHLNFARLTDEAVANYHAVSDVHIIPGDTYFNSGTIITSLSFNVPVVAMSTPVNREIQKLVGPNWLYLCEERLSAEAITTAMEAFDRAGRKVCDLSAFDPSLCAKQHIEAYKAKV